MKTKLIFLVMLISCFSCGTNNKPVSDAQKEKIKGEIKEVLVTFYKGCEEANLNMIIETWLDSPDFIMQSNGQFYNYQQCADLSKSFFNTLLNQQGTIKDETYAVLDNSTVMYTANSKWLMNFKDGHSVLQDPWAMQYLFKKIDNKWKIVTGYESGTEKNVPNESSKDLDQIELHKQFVGSWKTETVKDTTIFWDVTSYGTGFEGNFKSVAKGKIFMEGKQIWGYDKNLDKYSMSEMIKGMDNAIYSSWFTSKDKCAMLYFSDISNPVNATTKWEIEFKSPDLFIQNMIMNNKIVRVDKCTRIK